MDDRLSRLISEHNLDAHRARFAEEDIDLKAMAAMVDADLELARREAGSASFTHRAAA